MKIGKEEGQKIFLGCLVLGGMLYYYFAMLLDPLNVQEAKAHATVTDTQPKIDAANKAIKEVKPLQAKAVAAEATLEQIRGLIPDGSPVAWFPPSMTEFFKGQGIDKCGVHPAGAGGDKELVGFSKLSWGIDVPRVEVVKLAIAVAALENEHPLMEINSLQIGASRDAVQYQSARLNITTIIKQQ